MSCASSIPTVWTRQVKLKLCNLCHMFLALDGFPFQPSDKRCSEGIPSLCSSADCFSFSTSDGQLLWDLQMPKNGECPMLYRKIIMSRSPTFSVVLLLSLAY